MKNLKTPVGTNLVETGLIVAIVLLIALALYIVINSGDTVLIVMTVLGVIGAGLILAVGAHSSSTLY